jgi:hypothetical protein
MLTHYSSVEELFWSRVPKLYTNTEEILSRARRKFDEQNNFLEPSVIINNCCIIIIIIIIININA